MKKYTYKNLIMILIMMLALCSCSAGSNPPALSAEFSLSAVYKMGDFSYSCNIERNEDYIAVIPTSTNAAGLEITCDGKTIAFNRNGMVKSFDRENIDITNPALVLYEVFDTVLSDENRGAEKDGELFVYKGNCSLGTFTLSQNGDGTLNTITIPDANISVIFD